MDLNKNFEFTVSYIVNEDKTWKVSFSSEDDITEDDIMRFMGNLAVLNQKRNYNKFLLDEKEKYNKLSMCQKIIYHLKNK
jgi:hypothetical protein